MDAEGSDKPRQYQRLPQYPPPHATDSGVQPQAPSRHRRSRSSHKGRGPTSCKTCHYCRTRKIKCDGLSPQCSSCTSLGNTCSYPEDARRLSKPTRADFQALEAQIASLRALVQAENVPNSQFDNIAVQTHAPPPETLHLRQETCQSVEMQDIDSLQFLPRRCPLASPTSMRRGSDSLKSDNTSRCLLSTDFQPSAERAADETETTTIEPDVDTDADADVCVDVDGDAGPSPSEASVAGAIGQDGTLAVHGVSSIFHQPVPLRSRSSAAIPASKAERKLQNQISKARLIANAALQRQREKMLLRGSNMGVKVDLDGVNAELAFHLLNLHWNRFHYTYLISYRPAIMDSLMSNGPYCNTLLLNAIYFSSSILSDRKEVRSNPSDSQTAGLPFYERFRVLLVNEIDKPSIPTSVGLLLCGAALVSHGRPSAGWMMCGIAYRMIIDLGCHMTLDSRQNDETGGTALLSHVELEIRKRLYWGAFLTDATQSLYFGRPPNLLASQARVPQLLLDTFEELEDWAPYVDPLVASALPSYPPRPAYAISTFSAMARLFSVSTKIVHSFYSIRSLKNSPQNIRKIKAAVDSELEGWLRSIPTHLQYNPGTDSTPPPHQVTPFITFHALQILLHRPFLANGHLGKDFKDSERTAGEQVCVDAALAIWRLVESYKTAFTLRRAPYIICYSVYSAAVAILNQTLTERAHFTKCMRFFWSALTDLRRGCNFGLQKPLDILKDMMTQFGEDIPRSADQGYESSLDFMVMNKDPAVQQSMPRTNGTQVSGVDQSSQIESQQWDPFALWDSAHYGTGMEGDDWPLNDTLYGLFTPGLSGC